MRENYEILGLDENATEEELAARYKELREKYREERWQDGEAGSQAARMLTRVEEAYKEILSARKEQARQSEPSNAYEEISNLLREGDLSKAQEKLDECNDRGAEWHYLQAVVFYKKNWTNDSKKQLEIAMQMDPSNQKYRSAYDKMNAKNDYQKQEAHQQPYQSPYSYEPMPDDQMGGSTCSNCASCCYTYLCVDCLFSLCCGCR